MEPGSIFAILNTLVVTTSMNEEIIIWISSLQPMVHDLVYAQVH